MHLEASQSLKVHSAATLGLQLDSGSPVCRRLIAKACLPDPAVQVEASAEEQILEAH